MSKILIIRFSSFGDIVQSLSCLPLLKAQCNQRKIHFLTRSEFAGLVEINPLIDQVYKLEKKEGFKGLLNLIKELKKENYEIIYDSHRSLRTFFIRFLMLGIGPAFLPDFFVSPHFLTRSKERIKRLLLFKFRINLFPIPYKGMISYMRPLKILGIEPKLVAQKWNFKPQISEKVAEIMGVDYLQMTKMICLAPSAAWEMKRWPINHFKKLIQLMPEHKFIILGGKEDTFCQELHELDPKRVYDLSGKLSLVESCFVVSQITLLVCADTGLLHVADLIGKKAVALIGPTAFGHTSGSWVEELSVELDCRPCTKDGRGKCSQNVYQKCMVDITPDKVAAQIVKTLT